jgi:hypothetical protein
MSGDQKRIQGRLLPGFTMNTGFIHLSQSIPLSVDEFCS